MARKGADAAAGGYLYRAPHFGRRQARRVVRRHGGGQDLCEKGSVASLLAATAVRGRRSRYALLGLLFSFFPLFCVTAAADTPVRVSAARVWPATDYTRVTFE